VPGFAVLLTPLAQVCRAGQAGECNLCPAWQVNTKQDNNKAWQGVLVVQQAQGAGLSCFIALPPMH